MDVVDDPPIGKIDAQKLTTRGVSIGGDLCPLGSCRQEAIERILESVKGKRVTFRSGEPNRDIEEASKNRRFE
jgi:hypothetical protein